MFAVVDLATGEVDTFIFTTVFKKLEIIKVKGSTLKQ